MRKKENQLKETTTGRVQALKKAYLEAEMRFNDQYDNDNEEFDEEQVARKAREQKSLNYKYGTVERFEKELAKVATKKIDVFDEFEESEAQEIMKEDGAPEDDGKVQTDDVGIWRTILVKLLKTIVKEDSDARTAAKWNEICKRRLQDCATGEKQLLQFAEDLERDKDVLLGNMLICERRGQKK